MLNRAGREFDWQANATCTTIGHMFTPDQYELIDFGQHRKLERFGPLLLDRPAPNAPSYAPSSPETWRQATARYLRPQRGDGVWHAAQGQPTTTHVAWQQLMFELRLTPFGHVGLFPEQALCWSWIQDQVAASQVSLGRPLQVLNLFAYTGGSSLAAAAAGAQVTHVDAAHNIVDWARLNAQHSSLAHASIRWIVEDAAAFVRREVRRGKRYDAIILDPPSYGHGPQGQAWKIDKHLEPLLIDCRALLHSPEQLHPAPRFLLLTCHSPGYHAAKLTNLLSLLTAPLHSGRISAQPLYLHARDRRKLACGVQARWPA